MQAFATSMNIYINGMVFRPFHYLGGGPYEDAVIY